MAKTVIDVGCADWTGNREVLQSVDYLIREFSPDVLIGFDPGLANGLFPMQETLTRYSRVRGTQVRLYGAAAWLYDGEVNWVSDGTNSWVTDQKNGVNVPCVDLRRVISEIEDDVILKLDCEGAEYDLLNELLDTGVMDRVSLLWVEWHKPDRGRKEIEQRLSCEVHSWNL